MFTSKVSPQDFIKVLENIKSSNDVSLHGLVRCLDSNSSDMMVFKDSLPIHTTIVIEKDTTLVSMLSVLEKAFKNGHWIVFFLADGVLPLAWKDQFLRLRDSNTMFFQYENGKKNFYGELTSTMRIVTIIENHFIENDESDFINLFGPTLIIE